MLFCAKRRVNQGNFSPKVTIDRVEVVKMVYVIINNGQDDQTKNYIGTYVLPPSSWHRAVPMTSLALTTPSPAQRLPRCF